MGIEEDFKNFINQYKLSEKGKPYTHSSIGSPKIALNIPDEKLNEFYNLYNIARMTQMPLHLTEKPLDPSPLRVDFDFKFNLRKTDTDEPILDRDQYFKFENIINITKEYFKIIVEIIDKESLDKHKLWVCIMQKNTAKEDRGFLKDGIHLVFPDIIMNNKTQHYIRSKILEKAQSVLGDMFLANDYNNVIDKAVIDQSGWQMYGSSKPSNEPYLVRKVYNYNIDTENIEENSQILTDCTIQFKFVNILSMRKKEEPIQLDSEKEKEIDEHIKKVVNPQKKTANSNVEQTFLGNTFEILSNFDNDPETINLTKKLVQECLDVSRADNYADWMQLGWILKNIDCRLLDCWKDFSRLSSKYIDGECDEKWERFNKGSMSMGTLRWLAKIDNRDKYEEILTDSLYSQVDQAISGGAHFDVALVLHRKYGDEYRFVGKDVWYKYEPKEHRWVRIDEAPDLYTKISTEIYALFCDRSKYWINRTMTTDVQELKDNFKRKSEKALKIAQNLRMVNYKSGVFKECKFLFSDNPIETKFEELLDSKCHLLGFKNCVYDFETNSRRDGCPSDCISYSTKLNYKEYNPNSKEAKELDKFLREVMPNDNVRKYMLDMLACTLDGSVKQESFYIMAGKLESGSNGKSTLMNLVQKAFGDYYCNLPISLITQKRQSSNAAQSELERTKGRRIAVMQEPGEGDKINIGLMKELSGNDRIQARALFKNPIEFTPQFKMYLMCNAIPEVPGNDDGTWRRIKLIEFTSIFKQDPDPKKPNEYKKDANLSKKLEKWPETFISYLIHIRKNIDINNLVEPKEVVGATKQYNMNNNVVAQFINEEIKFDKAAKERITLQKIYQHYTRWFKMNSSNKKALDRAQLKIQLEKHEKFGPYDPKKPWRGIILRIEGEESTDTSEEDK